MKGSGLLRFVAWTLVMLLVGCATYTEIDPRVKVDDDLGRFIDIHTVVTDYKNDLLRFDVQGENRSTSPLRIGYVIDWYDASGRRIDTLLSRSRVIEVRGNGDFAIGGIAPEPAAVRFRVHLYKG